MASDQPSKRARRTSSSTSGAGESGHRRSSGQGRCRLSRCGSGHRRVRIPAVRLGFVVSPVDGLLARHAEGGEPTPVLGLRPDLPAPVTDQLDSANGMRQSMRYHGVLLDGPRDGTVPGSGEPVWSKNSNSPSHGRLRFYHRWCFGLSSAPLSPILSVNRDGKG